MWSAENHVARDAENVEHKGQYVGIVDYGACEELEVVCGG